MCRVSCRFFSLKFILLLFLFVSTASFSQTGTSEPIAEYNELDSSIYFETGIETPIACALIPMILQADSVVVVRALAPIAAQVFPDRVIRGLSEDEFFQLASQTSSLFAGPNREVPYYGLDISALLDRKWHALAFDNIRRSRDNVLQQTQMSEGMDRWGCGPNTGARAFELLGLRAPDANEFARRCPKSLSPQHAAGGIAAGGGVLAWGLAMVFPPAAIAVGAATIAASSMAGTATPVGPSPGDLARYLDQQAGIRAWHRQEGNFDAARNVIHSQISQNLPVIVLLIYNQFQMHYVNVVGINYDEQKIAVLETGSYFRWFSFSKFAELLDGNPYLFVNGYNLICLVRE